MLELINSYDDIGCEGGYISQAWKYMKSTGIVTEDCYAYKSGSSMSTGTCYLSNDECPSSSYVKPEFYTTVYGAYSLSGVTRIMYDIYTKGPVETALYVSEYCKRFKASNLRIVKVEIINLCVTERFLRTKPSFDTFYTVEGTALK